MRTLTRPPPSAVLLSNVHKTIATASAFIENRPTEKQATKELPSLLVAPNSIPGLRPLHPTIYVREKKGRPTPLLYTGSLTGPEVVRRLVSTTEVIGCSSVARRAAHCNDDGDKKKQYDTNRSRKGYEQMPCSSPVPGAMLYFVLSFPFSAGLLPYFRSAPRIRLRQHSPATVFHGSVYTKADLSKKQADFFFRRTAGISRCLFLLARPVGKSADTEKRNALRFLTRRAALFSTSLRGLSC